MGRIEDNLNAARPSSDPKFAGKIQRLIRPEALKKNEPLFWLPGMGTDVWEMFCAAITGDLETIKRLLEKDSSLVRCSYGYRTPLTFAVQENQVEVAAHLFDRGAHSFANPLEIARDEDSPRWRRCSRRSWRAPPASLLVARASPRRS